MSTARNQRSHLFTVKIWREPLGEGWTEIRYQAQHVLSGETRGFRDGAMLIAFLQTKLDELERAPSLEPYSAQDK
jgi:hypothetical protein